MQEQKKRELIGVVVSDKADKTIKGMPHLPVSAIHRLHPVRAGEQTRSIQRSPLP